MQLFDFFLSLVRHYPPDAARQEFRFLFLEYRSNSLNAEAFADLQHFVLARDQQGFTNALKRCCYILVNNWETSRESDAVVGLIEDFTAFAERQRSVSQERARVQGWLHDFLDSPAYDDLRLFATRHDRHGKLSGLAPTHWSKRYTSYLLVPQYADSHNSPEQRQAARKLSKELKDKFKFDLAMYTARSQSSVAAQAPLRNPTGLGPEVVKLIKRLIIRRGQFSHANLAHIFLKQTQDIEYAPFKDALYNYLTFAVDARDLNDSFHQQFYKRLKALYPQHDERRVCEGDGLILRTCNRIFDLLIVEEGEQPAELFIRLLSQSNPLMLAIMLLKLVLICPSSRTHLESRIAILIRYYMKFPEEECKWAVNFFEIFNITFAIYADQDVQYNLIRIDQSKEDKASNTEAYQIFSQHASQQGWLAADAADSLEGHLSP